MTGKGISWVVVSWIALVALWSGVGTTHAAQAAPARPGDLGDPFYDRAYLL